MQFLTTVTVFFHHTPVFYKISRMNDSDYLAEPTDKNMRSFVLRKNEGAWISEGGSSEWQGIQIGKEIDNQLNQGIIK